MRQPFDNTCNLWRRNGGIVASSPYLTNIPCRFVLQNRIFPLTFGPPYVLSSPARIGYVTMLTLPYTVTFSSPGFMQWKFVTDTNDLLEMNSGFFPSPGILNETLLVEQVDPFSPDTYYRVWIFNGPYHAVP